MSTGQEFEITVDQGIDNGSTDMAATARRHLKSVPEQTSYLEDTAGFLEYLGAVAREVQSKPMSGVLTTTQRVQCSTTAPLTSSRKTTLMSH